MVRLLRPISTTATTGRPDDAPATAACRVLMRSCMVLPSSSKLSTRDDDGRSNSACTPTGPPEGRGTLADRQGSGKCCKPVLVLQVPFPNRILTSRCHCPRMPCELLTASLMHRSSASTSLTSCVASDRYASRLPLFQVSTCTRRGQHSLAVYRRMQAHCTKHMGLLCRPQKREPVVL